MTKPTRRLVVLAAVVSAVIAVLMFLVSVGKGLAAPVSNCNRDCDDGTGALYAALVCGGLTVVLAIVAALAPRTPAPTELPEARARPK
jgi:hypothetical protein